MSEQWVIDASVLVQGFMEDTYSRRVDTLLAELNISNPPVLHIPETCLAECANVLWKQVRFHGTSVADAKLALHNLINLNLTVYPSNLLLPRALEIALEHTLAVYDALYLALAQQMNLPLITVDARQRDIAEKLRIQIKPLTDFPEYEDQKNG